MWKFNVEQKRFEVSGVRIGGVPGERPIVLVGSIFYHGHKIVKDERTGEFDKGLAEELINRQQEFSDKTGNPCMLDVVGSTSEALNRFLDFTAGVTDIPLLMDGVSSAVRVKSLEYVEESGLQGRVVYNSLTPEFREEELTKIKDVGVESAVLLAYNTKDFTSKGRVEAVKKLLPLSEKAGIRKPLIDICVLDIPTLGIGCRAIQELKRDLGVPTGCGAHNAIGTWKGLKTKMGGQAEKPCMAAANVLAVAVGADFLLYGPIGSAEYVFPAVAMVDAAYGQLALEDGKMPGSTHPLFKIA
jgi:tetrahydromethanopterin S-methyltransferase subunit H